MSASILTPFGYFDLIETFPQHGCPVCKLLLRDAEQMLDSLSYEFVLDSEVQAQFRASRGLCSEHGWQLITIGNALSIATLHETVLSSLLETMDKLSDGDLDKRGMGWQRSSRSSAALAKAVEPTAPCMVCAHQERSEKIYLRILVEHLEDERMQAAFRASEGLCLEHFIRALRQAQAGKQTQLLVDIQREIWTRLHEELVEFMRKYDFHNVKETMGIEGDSWRRVVARLSGEKGVFGIRRKTHSGLN